MGHLISFIFVNKYSIASYLTIFFWLLHNDKKTNRATYSVNIKALPKWSRTFIEFSIFSKFRESDRSMKHIKATDANIGIIANFIYFAKNYWNCEFPRLCCCVFVKKSISTLNSWLLHIPPKSWHRNWVISRKILNFDFGKPMHEVINSISILLIRVMSD